jgi:hypothetical protein
MIRHLLLSLSLVLAFACQRRAPITEAEPLPLRAAPPSEPAKTTGSLLGPALEYPPGPWRTAAADDVERLVLWASHLLVRYQGSKDPDNVPFKMAAFHAVPPPPTRTREEALARARELAQQARSQPQRFPELVREHSEDLARRERNGSLGGIPATQLTPWPEVLDALTALAPGEVSDVVETWYGFHIFQRHAAPPADTVTGRRIVIAHDQARFLSILLGEPQPARSRSEAFELARRLYERASAAPETFPQLIERYSEHPDRIAGGDFGTWHNRELTPFPTEVEVLDQLEVGQVAAPVDSLFGVEILMRVPNPERAVYAFDGVQLDFDPEAADGHPKSRAQVQAEARELTQVLLRDPLKLPSLTQQYASYRMQWLDGRGVAEWSAAVRAVAVGEVLPEPPRSGRLFLVGRRIPPSDEAPVAALSELPARSGG